MEKSSIKDAIIALLFTALMITASLYVGARDDIDRLRQANIRMFNMLPGHQQEILVTEDQLRAEMMDPGPYQNPWDR